MKVRRGGWIAACALAAACSFAARSAVADVTGSVTLEGEAPEMEEINMAGAGAAGEQCAEQHAEPVLDDRVIVGENAELANVVVSLKKADGTELTGEVPADPVVLDQVGCQYVPHVVAAMVGQTVLAKSQDDFAHNVHPVPFEEGNPEQNIGFIGVDRDGKELGPYETPEKFQTECNVHPWMKARICVFPHPYFAVTAEDGTYTIPTAGLEDGEYVVVYWHEVFTPGSEGLEGPTITITDGAAEAEPIAVDAAGAEANAGDGADVAGGEVVLASLVEGQAAPAKRCADGSCCKKATKAQAIEAVADAGEQEE